MTSFVELVFQMFLLCQVMLTSEVNPLSKLITHDCCWLFSAAVQGYPLLQTLVFKADWQYHGSATLTVECILLILLVQHFVFGTGHKVQGGGPAEIGGGSSIFKLMRRGGSPKYWSCLQGGPS